MKASQKEQARSAESVNRRSKETLLKSISDQLKKPQKIAKKCLDPAFLASLENISPGKLEPIDSSPVSEISVGDRRREVSESFMPDSALSASSETFKPSNFSPSAKIIEDKQESGDDTVDYNGSDCCDNSKSGNIDLQITVDFLKDAVFQVSSSSDVDLRSKKALDSLVKIFIEDLYRLPEERDHLSELVSAKLRIGLLCFLWWLILVSLVLLSNYFTGSPFPDPQPT